MKNIILTILTLFLFSSCRKEANIKLPVTKSLPVVHCFISPEDTILRVKVTSSQPLYQNTGTDIYASVNNAVVEIKSDQGNANFIYNTLSEYYELSSKTYSILPGKVYKLQVTTASGDIATAETQIPQNIVSIDNLTYETIKDQMGESKNFKISFTDESSIKNYYNLSVAGISIDQMGDTIIKETGIRTLHDDVNKNGAYTTLSGRYFYYEGDSIKAFDAYLLNCSASYYKFHLSLQNYTGDNPFSEPTLTFNNISGGYGVFASYRKTKKRITI